MNESDIISSRRNFLKNMAYGSLLMVGGIDVAHAKAKVNVKAKVSVKAKAKHTVLSKKAVVTQRAAVTQKARVHDTLHQHLASSTKVSSAKVSSSKTLSTKAPATAVHAPPNRIIHNALLHNSPSHKVLALHNTHTGDRLKLTYFEQGRYIKDALHEINHLFRDYHDGSIHPIDTALLDQLYDLKHVLEVRKPFHIVSAYRSPATNADLRRHSDGVAKNSLHMQGRAIDIRIEGVDTRRIRNAALAMQRGGVGYYGKSNFVHLDTGSVRNWAG